MDKGGLILLILILAIVITVAALGTMDTTEISIAQAQVGIAAAPAAVSPLNGLWDFAFKVLIVLAALAILGGLVYLVYERARRRPNTGSWISGPNAQWGRQGVLPGGKKLSTNDLLTAMLLEKYLDSRPARYGDRSPADGQRHIEF
ncbi:MAG: hypothetical protein WCE68_15245 [Anaerolineales bacterium]